VGWGAESLPLKGNFVLPNYFGGCNKQIGTAGSKSLWFEVTFGRNKVG